MKIKSINPLLFIGLIGVFTIGSSFTANLLSAFYGNQDMYWTHSSMKLPFEETYNDFQVFISEKPLQTHLSDHTLFSVDQNGVQYTVVAKDVSVRINNWPQVKSRRLIIAVFTGVAFGANLALLVMGIIQTIAAKKGKTEPPPDNRFNGG